MFVLIFLFDLLCFKIFYFYEELEWRVNENFKNQKCTLVIYICIIFTSRTMCWLYLLLVQVWPESFHLFS